MSTRDSWTRLGPWGGVDGERWDYEFDGPIWLITVCYNEKYVTGFSFQTESGMARNQSPTKIGRTEAGKKDHKFEAKEFRIDNSEERLSSINVRWNDYYLRCITFKTNKGRSEQLGAYERKDDKKDNYPPLEADKFIVGFHGLFDPKVFGYPTAIGVYVAPISVIEKVKSWPRSLWNWLKGNGTPA